MLSSVMPLQIAGTIPGTAMSLGLPEYAAIENTSNLRFWSTGQALGQCQNQPGVG